jgi:hypothetical protein
MSTVGANSIAAARAWNQSLTDYGNFIDQSMRQYGWTMPNASGQYSVQSAQDAFDPQTMLQFGEDGRPSFDAASLGRMGSVGQYGTTGLFAETTQMGAAREAEARMGAQARGIKGGLAAQQERLAETLAGRELSEVSRSMFEGISGGFGGIMSSYEDVVTAEQLDRIAAAQAAAGEVSPFGEPVAAPPDVAPVGGVPAGVAAGTAGGIVPPGQARGEYSRKGTPSGLSADLKKAQQQGKLKAGQEFKGTGGVMFIWRPNGPQGSGWYRKP